MFKLEFDPSNRELAAAIGEALVNYGTGSAQPLLGQDVLSDSSLAKQKVFAQEDTAIETLAEAVEDFSKNLAGGIEVTQEDTATETATTSTDTESDPASALTMLDGDPARLDEHGVAFNPNYCGNAAKPFYGSGKTKGQWKKKQGLDQTEYNIWYASQLEVVALLNDKPETEADVDTAGAFAGPDLSADQPYGTPAADAPIDGGDLMKWISEMQTAAKITQQDVDAAYAQTGKTLHDLFNPSLEKEAVAAIYGVLSQTAAARG